MRVRLAALGAAVLALGLAAPAQGAAPDPDFHFLPGDKNGFEGPCGLAVDSAANLYISDYYRNDIHVYSFAANPPFLTGIDNVDPLDGPCGLAFDGVGSLYVNNYHRNVEKFALAEYPAKIGSPFPIGTSVGIFDSAHPTGVAVDPATGTVYVNARTYVAAYAPNGAPVMDGGQPLRIGEGSLGDGYGLAFSTYIGTSGLLYVPDAADDTVKVYDPDAANSDDPVATIDGAATPTGGFVSLHDSAVAVDSLRGDVYVIDTLGPQLSERPEATIYAFGASGAYDGRLKYNVVDAAPSGLAIDESRDKGAPTPTQGRVYVTSGNTGGSGVYAYPPDAATPLGLPAALPLSLSAAGPGEGSIVSAQPQIDCDSTCAPELPGAARVVLTAIPDPGSVFVGWSGAGCAGTGSCVVTMDHARAVKASFERPSDPPLPASPDRTPLESARTSAGAAVSAVAQKGSLRVAVTGKFAPKRLPRKGVAPISVSVGGEITTTDDSLPPQLKALRVELNREGRLDPTGLPRCDYDAIQPGSSQRALTACRDALVGQGSFTANITLAGQEPYPTNGKLLVFNAVEKGRPVLYGHIYAPRPFATSFVIVFAVERIGKGDFGTALNAPLPRAMDAWGRLTGLQMTLSRRYSHGGQRRSFLSAGCPAPKGFNAALFPLARTEFSFAGGQKLRSTLTSQCRVRG